MPAGGGWHGRAAAARLAAGGRGQGARGVPSVQGGAAGGNCIGPLSPPRWSRGAGRGPPGFDTRADARYHPAAGGWVGRRRPLFTLRRVGRPRPPATTPRRGRVTRRCARSRTRSVRLATVPKEASCLISLSSWQCCICVAAGHRIPGIERSSCAPAPSVSPPSCSPWASCWPLWSSPGDSGGCRRGSADRHQEADQVQGRSPSSGNAIAPTSSVNGSSLYTVDAVFAGRCVAPRPGREAGQLVPGSPPSASRAIDVMVNLKGSCRSGRKNGNDVARYFMRHARQHNVQYIIWKNPTGRRPAGPPVPQLAARHVGWQLHHAPLRPRARVLPLIERSDGAPAV